MNSKDLTLMLCLALIAGMIAVGCGSSSDMSQDEAKKAKGAPAPMTDAQKSAMQSQMTQGSKAAQSADAAFLASHSKEEIAKVNAQRAQGGRPPLGQ
jgi:hypothetical protein